MFRRGEPVPFAFVAEADRFRSNVTPPARARRSFGEVAGSALVGLTIVAGLVGSVLLGLPALSADHSGPAKEHPAAAERR
ncbi:MULTISPECIES: hypothetical protein [unclassified Streptomyces]|uniref:hypothetical protein n=1 Tax=unclassified Streptomyces TaxID=2593676 RepID=UPI002DDC7102|nr:MULTISPECIES: hypothetical protein [unclassified Streptomyces]WSA92024.1 hypothetical protein OIE63_10935 [Streptomyces sp. NBC_01795]WSB76391.1 hypothetical protein OHB04_11730 [Streptomyces sp. NBC_01775]WSS15334.1 hypothetical protein OG533_28185 [Streptomyces sp. NBC_01186]WSS44179.1 hypothetical protein OG220_28995 [Streptomyces sp. NBC_01187]